MKWWYNVRYGLVNGNVLLVVNFWLVNFRCKCYYVGGSGCVGGVFCFVVECVVG